MKYTFGKSLAAVKLEKLVESDSISRRKISTLLSQYTDQLLKVVKIKDPSVVQLCMSLLRDYTLRRISIKKNLSPEIITYSQNVVIARYRVFSHQFKEVSELLEKGKIHNKA